jgi:hypothetical protein
MKMPTSCIKTIIPILFFLSSNMVHAQELKKQPASWTTIHGGMGLTNIENRVMLVGVNTNFSFKNKFVQVGLNGNLVVFGNSLTDVNISIGGRKKYRFAQLAWFAGPSWVMFSENRQSNRHSVGLNSSVQFIFRPLSIMGFGFDIYTNLNFLYPVVGLRALLYFSNGK